MEYQKFIPEGWVEKKEELNMVQLKDAFYEGKVIQGYVGSCDENYNLHICLGKDIKGIIPRNELEAIDTEYQKFIP